MHLYKNKIHLFQGYKKESATSLSNCGKIIFHINSYVYYIYFANRPLTFNKLYFVHFHKFSIALSLIKTGVI